MCGLTTMYDPMTQRLHSEAFDFILTGVFYYDVGN